MIIQPSHIHLNRRRRRRPPKTLPPAQVKPTIKEVDAGLNVVKTLTRAKLWEVQTPQCVRPQLLRDGFKLVAEKGLEVTDDVSIVEAMGLPVRITPGAYTNIKVTTPDDMLVATGFLDEAGR